jgi:hypothetical protein
MDLLPRICVPLIHGLQDADSIVCLKFINMIVGVCILFALFNVGGVHFSEYLVPRIVVREAGGRGRSCLRSTIRPTDSKATFLLPLSQ